MPPQARSLTLAPGDDLPSAITEGAAALGSDAWVQAVGHLEAVELRLASEGADPVRSLRGRFTLVSLVGPLRGPLSVTLARTTDAGIELLGGQLVRARSAGVSVLLTPTSALDDAAEPAARPAAPAPRSVAPPPEPRHPITQAAAPEPRPQVTQVAQVAQAAPEPRAPIALPAVPPAAPAPPAAPPAAAPTPAPSPFAMAMPASLAATPLKPPTAAATTSWGDVAQASERAIDDPDDPDNDPQPGPGDHVDHFSFGLCEVITTDGERLRIRDLRGPGRIREISLAMLNIGRPTASNGKQLFRLMRK
jgi:hypothetical protein